MRSITWFVVLGAALVGSAQESPTLSAEALHKRAQARAKKEPQQALADLTAALKLKPDWGEALLDRARLRKRLGDAKGAEADCDAALTKISGWYDALELRGHIKRARGDLKGAEADWTAAAKAPGNWGGAQFNLGTLRLEQRDPKGAVAHFDAAIKLSATYADAYLNRGFAKYQLADMKGAIADCDRALELRPTWGEAYFNRGTIKVSAGDLKGAAADFTQCLKRIPHHRDARINRARVLQDLSDHVAALKDFDAVLKAADDPEVRYYRARSRWARGDAKGAAADAKQSAARRSDWTPPLALAAEIALEGGDAKAAVALLTQAIAKAPTDPNLYVARAHALARADSVRDAILSCDGALKLQPRASGALLLRGLLHGRSGDRAAAVKDMLAFTKLDARVYGPLWVAGWTGHTDALKPFAAEPGWSGALARFGLGTLDADGLLKAAKSAATPQAKRERLCEAYGYLGLFAERAKKPAEAKAHYAACWKHRVKDFVEAEWARARLKALGK